jgi:aspartate/methionine/tyrosine aminotransferase
MAMKSSNHVLGGLGTTIFTVMSALAQEHQAVNLGQGFPDTDGPEDVRAAAARALMDGPNQYPPMMGMPALRQAVADHDRRFLGIDLDWTRDVLVTSGATEALTAALLAFLEPGDEVVLFEPLYDSYLPIVRLAGAVPKLVRLAPPDASHAEWSIPADALARAFSPQTKLVLLNTPLNPVGKVFTADEINAVVDLAAHYDAIILADEVYEHLVFDGRPHISPLQHPKGRGRTIRVGSAGKTFSLTGWKVGYLSGPAELIGLVAKAHQYLTFTTPPARQASPWALARTMPIFQALPRIWPQSATAWPRVWQHSDLMCCRPGAPISSPLASAALMPCPTMPALPAASRWRRVWPWCPSAPFMMVWMRRAIWCAFASASRTACWTRPWPALAAGQPPSGGPLPICRVMLDATKAAGLNNALCGGCSSVG